MEIITKKKFDEDQKKIDEYTLIKKINRNEASNIPNIFIVRNDKNEIYIGSQYKIQYIKSKIENIFIRYIENLRKIRELKEKKEKEKIIVDKPSHKNIINYITTKKTDNNKYIFTEYCNGGNLKNFQEYYINKFGAHLNEKIIQKVIKQIVNGLEYLHKEDIIHRDINLENIFINFDKFENKIIEDERGQEYIPKINIGQLNLNEIFKEDSISFKIANFYHSKDLSKQQLEESIIFTETNFLTPEMLNNEKEQIKFYNKKFDIWSLGIITYELLTGKKPFERKSKEEDICNNIIKGNYILPKNLKVSKEIISFINGLLAYNPEKRLDWEKIRNHPFLTKKVDNFEFEKFENNKEISIKNNQNINLNNFLSENEKIEINNSKGMIRKLMDEYKNELEEFEKELNKVKKNKKMNTN